MTDRSIYYFCFRQQRSKTITIVYYKLLANYSIGNFAKSGINRFRHEIFSKKFETWEFFFIIFHKNYFFLFRSLFFSS